MFDVDFIIVGQGLAGSTLALTLQKNNQSFVIIDNQPTNSSSLVASGISHPMSFKRLILSWRADILIPFSQKFYFDQEKFLGESCYEKHKMFRVFSSIEEQNKWHSKSSDEIFKKILKESKFKLNAFSINNQFGFGEINLAGRLNVSKFILLCRKYFFNSNQLIKSEIDYSKIKCANESIHYKNIQAKNIVFCEGSSFLKNPFFNYLPSKLSKGEILTIESNELPEKLISKGCFLLPIKNNKYIVGSTYEHEDLSDKNTKKGRKILIEKLMKVGDFKYKIISQKNGIRPSTIDRRPLVGEHPEIKNMYIFNGLGSKGVMLSPYFANQLVNNILHNTKLDPEANISRFSKFYPAISILH